MRLVCLLFLGVFGLPSMAALLTGIVTDQDGIPIPGAVVAIEGTNVRVATDSEGRYRLTELPGDRVQLHVSSPNHVHLKQWLDLVGNEQTEHFVMIPTHTTNIVFTANALERSVLDSAVPVTVLSGERLQRDQAPTLGETLRGTTGVHSSYFGPVAASPIIRGSDGPRVKMVQNGLDSSDVSRVGQDHAVAMDAATASRIEVLRGPATLQFGDGAIGGVVNVVDNRMPRNLAGDGLQGEVELRMDSASEERFGKVKLTGGSGNLAYHFNGFSRRTDDLEIPGFAEAEPDDDAESGVLPNSDIDTESYTGGFSWSGRDGFLGVSAQRLDNRYGVPGHSHHGHGHEDDDHKVSFGADDDLPAEAEESVFLDVDMERYQVRGEWFAPVSGLQKVSVDSGWTDYSHLEIEDGAEGTTFASETFENRLAFTHEPLKGWEGVLGIHHSRNDYSALGAEAFTPPSRTQSLAIYLAEERKFQDVRVQVGARYNYSKITPDGVARIDLGHDDDHDHAAVVGSDDEEPHEEALFELDRQTFQSFSVSTGLNWSYAQGRSAALVLTRAERAPSTPELFSAGAHLATSTYELGAVFALDPDGEVSFQPDQVNTETSTGLDLTMRKFDGRWGYSVSAFYNQADDYFYQKNTGLVFADEHDDHDEAGKSGEDEEEGLPVLIFQQADAVIYGLEFELHTQFSQSWTGRFFGDGVRTQLDAPQNGTRNLPRLPPLRLGVEFDYQTPRWSADLGATWYDDQTRVAAFETTTPGYTLAHAGVSYRHKLSKVALIGFLRGKNLADEEARVHTSFIKDQAPLPGRSLVAGFRVEF